MSLLTRLGQKVYRPDGTPASRGQAGLLALLVVWVPRAAGLWAVRNLTLSEPLFDLLFLLLMLESWPLRELAQGAAPLATQETLVVARLQAAPLAQADGETVGDGAEQGGERDLRAAPRGPVGRPPAGLCPRRGAGCPALAPRPADEPGMEPEAGRVRPLRPPAATLYQGTLRPAILLLALPCA